MGSPKARTWWILLASASSEPRELQAWGDTSAVFVERVI